MRHADPAASLVVAVLERAWTAIHARHPDVPTAVLVVASGASGRQLAFGHFAAGRWHAATSDEAQAEVLVGGEGLGRGPAEVLGTLLHEAAHGLAHTRRIQDTSRGGRYHNRRYAALAREVGLDVANVHPIGWSATTVPAATAARYARVLADMEQSLRLWRRLEQRFNRAASPEPSGVHLRMSKADPGSPSHPRRAPIVCTACAQPFQPIDA